MSLVSTKTFHAEKQPHVAMPIHIHPRNVPLYMFQSDTRDSKGRIRRKRNEILGCYKYHENFIFVNLTAGQTLQYFGEKLRPISKISDNNISYQQTYKVISHLQL